MYRIPTVTKNLLIINCIAFLAMLALRQTGFADLNYLCSLHFFMASDFHVYQLLTYMFMHGGWEHIIINMFMLWMFGAVVEQTWGGKRFLFYYIFCGVGAGLLQEIAQFFYVWFGLITPQPETIGQAFDAMEALAPQLNVMTTVGASGAIYALLLAFGMMFPNERMFIIPIPIPIKAKWMVVGSIAVELFLGLQGNPGDNVAHLAHVGGMLFGFFLIRYWQKHPYANGFQGGSQIFGNMRDRWERSRHGHGWHRQEKSTGNPDWDYNAAKKKEQDEVDRILDKIRKSGYDSLTKQEKLKLFDQSKK